MTNFAIAPPSYNINYSWTTTTSPMIDQYDSMDDLFDGFLKTERIQRENRNKFTRAAGDYIKLKLRESSIMDKIVFTTSSTTDSTRAQMEYNTTANNSTAAKWSSNLINSKEM